MSQQISIRSDIKIFIICDTGAVRDIISQGLRSLGLKELEYEAAGMSALRRLRSGERFDVLICERDLPDLSGFEILREIGESDEIAAGSSVLVSSSFSKPDVSMAAELGCDGFLVKPFTLKDLSLKVTQCFTRMADPLCVESMIRKAKNLSVKGEVDRAIDAYLAVRDTIGKSARVSVGLGRNYRKLSDHTAALMEFEFAVQANPMYVHAYQERGLCYLEMGQTQDALAEFEKALKISPNNPVRYEIIADLLYNQKEFEKAESYLMRAIKLELAYPELYAQLGKTLFAQKKPEKAAQFLEKALKRDPKNTSFLNSLGICYKELGKTDLALDRYNQALKLNPTDTKVIFNKVLCLIALSDLDRAQKSCELILRIDPHFSKATAKLKEIEKLRKDSAKAG